MTETAPARLHVILARSAPVGVVIRRGPTGQVATLLWDRRTDSLSLGQWLAGRIYARRADLSPDGRHMIYFAMNARWDSETGGSWSAISRAPWLKAQVLWGKGDCWLGGGLFLDDRRYWLNGVAMHRPLADDGAFARVGEHGLAPGRGGECWSVYLTRLQRDGWEMLGCAPGRVDLSKAMPRGWVLHKLAHADGAAPPGKGTYWDEHLLEAGRGGAVIAGAGWEWADRDGADLVYTEAGCLWRRRILAPDRLGAAARIADLNAMRFEAIAAPY